MTEKQLIELDFKKINVTADESGSNAYYYYSLQLGNGYCNFSTPANDEIHDNHWPVYEFNLMLETDDYEKLSQFIIAFNNLL
jgi:hypothetical protein